MKVLEPAKDHAGLSQADFYQVYAYARASKEKYREIFLLYPATVALGRALCAVPTTNVVETGQKSLHQGSSLPPFTGIPRKATTTFCSFDY